MVIDIRPYCGAYTTYDIHKLACVIANNTCQQNDVSETIILDLGSEGFDIVENGIEQAVKDITDILKIDHNRVVFRSSDRLCKSNIFRHVINHIKYSYFFWLHMQDMCDINLPVANNYGIFLGRGTNERLYSFYKHKTWKNHHLGKASMHFFIEEMYESRSIYNFVEEYPDKWKFIKDLLPYSDTQDNFNESVSVRAYQANDYTLWNKIYENISVEIVCETSQTENNFFITEKTLRPISHGRLFMIIGSPKFEKNLKDMGFDIFDDIINKEYDKESGYIRIDKLFDSLDSFLKKDFNMKAILPRLKANQQVIRRTVSEIIIDE